MSRYGGFRNQTPGLIWGDDVLFARSRGLPRWKGRFLGLPHSPFSWPGFEGKHYEAAGWVDNKLVEELKSVAFTAITF